MGRDLHDVVAGHLSAIALQSEAVLSMADDDPATARTVLTSVRQNSLQSLAEMKVMIDLLRTEDADSHTAPVSMLDPASRVYAGGLPRGEPSHDAVGYGSFDLSQALPQG